MTHFTPHRPLVNLPPFNSVTIDAELALNSHIEFSFDDYPFSRRYTEGVYLGKYDID